MVRPIAHLAVAGGAAVISGLIACSAPQSPAGAGVGQAPRTGSAIAGQTLRCPQDYPDSRLVFAADGTISGRYAGREVSGEWTALAPGRVEMLVRAGGIAIRDTMQRTATGWRGTNTECG